MSKFRWAIPLRALSAIVLAALILPAPRVFAAATLIINGHGKGHGAGMCMAGVEQRAQDGQTWQEIVGFYYTGVGITQMGSDTGTSIKVMYNGQVLTCDMRYYLSHLREEPDDWPREGLKALAVAGRTFAYSRMRAHKHDGYDVCSSGDCCQAFDPGLNLPNTLAAVDATSGSILTYGGQPIVAAYSGCCGGITIGNPSRPYQQSLVDDACELDADRNWTREYAWSDFEAIMADLHLGEIYGYSIESRDAYRRVTAVRIEGAGGSVVMTGEEFRRRLDLPTTFFGTLSRNFQEYILVQNPGETPAEVDFTFMLPVGDAILRDFTIGPHSRFTLPVHDVIANDDVSVKVESATPLVAERAMYYNYRGQYAGGHAAMGVSEPQNRWYLAEGYTGGGFDTWILLQNPDIADITVTIEFLTAAGPAPVEDYRLPAHSRMSVGVDSVEGLADAEVSAVVTASGPIVAERAMYFDAGGRRGGSCAPGQPEAGTDWLLAEGYTGGSFDTYVLVMNPQAQDLEVTFDFMLPDGRRQPVTRTVAAGSRSTLHLDEVSGLENTPVSVAVRAAAPVVAERAVYFDYGGWQGGHCSAGVTSAASRWYFAEGCTYSDFHTYFLLQNSGAAPVTASLSFMLDDGRVLPLEVELPPNSRHTVFANEVPGLAGQSFSTVVEAAAPVVAERSMYFRYQGSDGGHNSTGVTVPAETWYFAEGCTRF
ncbi:MAG: DUF5719 family protein [Candidatus Geothermincolia bacterium]